MMGKDMLQRGNVAMGFDQNKIRHNFTETAVLIVVNASNPTILTYINS